MKINKPFKGDLLTASKNYGLQLQPNQITQANVASAREQFDQMTLALTSSLT